MRKLRKGDLVKCVDNTDAKELTIDNYYLVDGTYSANVLTKGINIKNDKNVTQGYLVSRFEAISRKSIRNETINNILK